MVAVVECPWSAPSHGVVFRREKPDNSVYEKMTQTINFIGFSFSCYLQTS